MKKALIVTLITICYLSPVYAKQWRGITPLHSTMADVERVLGKPFRFMNHWGTYQTTEETISILFSNASPCTPKANSEWNVPEGRVVSITVAPRNLVLFASLNVDESKYRKVPDQHKLDSVQYLNLEQGESFTVVNGEISSFEYFADSASNHLKCSGKPIRANPAAE